MRILRIADIANNRSGGMSRTLYGTGDELERMGHSVDYWMDDTLGSGNVRPQFRRFVIPFRIVRQVRAALAAGKRYDLVELHEPLGAAYAVSRRSLPPLALFSYGLEDRSLRATLDYRRRKGLPISLKNRYSPLSVVWQALYATRHAHHVVCSNSEDVEHLVHRGRNRSHLTLHHSGVEAEFLNAGNSLPPPSQRRGILFLGAWLVRKGILDLVPAAIPVLQRHPHTHLTIAGCMADESIVRKEFPASIQSQLRVVPKIQGNAALIEIYRQHSIFVLPSYFEGQPLAMIEAAALGLPIVTTALCGMKDFVRSGENGITVPVADPAALSQALDSLVAHPDTAAQLGENARRLAQSHTWKTAAEKIAAGYLRTLSSRPA